MQKIKSNSQYNRLRQLEQLGVDMNSKEFKQGYRFGLWLKFKKWFSDLLDSILDGII